MFVSFCFMFCLLLLTALSTAVSASSAAGPRGVARAAEQVIRLRRRLQDGTDVIATFKQVPGEAVSESVAAGRFRHASLLNRSLDRVSGCTLRYAGPWQNQTQFMFLH